MNIIKYLKECFKENIYDSNELLKAVDRNKRYAVLSARKYIMWLMEHNHLDDGIGEKYLRILCVTKNHNSIDIFVYSDNDVKRLYKNIDNDRISMYFKILLYSGIRITELSKMLMEFEKKRLMVVNGEFMRYQLNWVRGEKKAFYVYLPIELKPQLKQYYKVSPRQIEDELRKYGIKGKILRKVNYNKLLLAGINDSIADFIQNRVADSIGSRHYANMLLQADSNYLKALPLLKNLISESI
ncbi:MAG: integrase [Thermoplasmata archaeon]